MSNLSWPGSRRARVHAHASALLVAVRITVMQTRLTVRPDQLTFQRRLSGTSSNVLRYLRQQQRHSVATWKHAPRHVVTCDVAPSLPSQVVIKKVTSALHCRNDPSAELRERAPLAPAAADRQRRLCGTRGAGAGTHGGARPDEEARGGRARERHRAAVRAGAFPEAAPRCVFGKFRRTVQLRLTRARSGDRPAECQRCAQMLCQCAASKNSARFCRKKKPADGGAQPIPRQRRRQRACHALICVPVATAHTVQGTLGIILFYLFTNLKCLTVL